MKKILLTVLAIFSFSVLGAAHAQTIRFATEATYPPFEYMNAKNEIEGFDIDIANAICSTIGAQCTFTHHAFDSIIPSLKLRRFDASIAGMDITEERKKQVSFTDPYYDNSARFIAVKSKAAELGNYAGKRVGVQNGTTHQKYLENKHKSTNIVAYDSYQNAILDLKNGRLDAVFGDSAVIAEWLKTNNDLTSVGQNITDPAYFGTGLAMAVRQNNTELLNQLNQGLKTIRANGTYQTIYNKWFGATK